MAAPRGPSPGRSWTQRSRRSLRDDASTIGRGGPTPTPWIDDDIRLARDLGALMQAGLIVAVEDGNDDIRYAISENEDWSR